MDNKNIYLNHTLEEYNKKYRNRNYKLLKISKKEVEDFDKRNSTSIKGYLLKDRKWWFIKDTYYEIPKAPRATWFRNLNAGIQVATCALGAGLLATAIVVPTVLSINKDGSTREVSIDEAIKHVKCESKIVEGRLEITLKPDTGYEIKGISKVKINNYELKNNEYTFNNNVLMIQKEVLDAHTGKAVIVTPIISPVTPKGDVKSIKIENLPTKTKYYFKEKFDLTGLKVMAEYEDGSKEECTSECEVDLDKEYIFEESDLGKTKDITVSYKGKTVKYQIKGVAFEDYLKLSQNGDDYYVSPKSDDIELPKYLALPDKMKAEDGTEHQTKGCAGYYAGFKNRSDIEILDIRNTHMSELIFSPFDGCKKLKKIIIDDFTKTLGVCGVTFNECEALEEIHVVPSNINQGQITFTSREFEGCTNIKNVIIDSPNFANAIAGDDSLFVAPYVYIKNNINLIEESYIYNNYDKASSSDKEGYYKYLVKTFKYIDLGDNTYSVKQGNGCKGDIIIPTTYKDKQVAKVAESAFVMNNKITSVVVDVPFDYAGQFFGCTGLKKIYIKSGVTSIGGCLNFYGCSIEEITIDSENVAFLTDNTSYLYSYIGCKVKVLNTIVEKTEFNNGYLKAHSTQDEVGDTYTTFTITS